MEVYQTVDSGQLLIDLEAIRFNLQQISSAGRAIMPMIKANGYGTDAVSLSRFFQTCRVPFVGVSHVSEGVLLREEGITLPIFVLCAPPFDAQRVVQFQLQAAVCTFDEARALNQMAKHHPLPVHLHVNTGMNRFGVSYQKAPKLAQYINSLPALKLEGVMTHFSTTDDPLSDPFVFKQIHRFKTVVDQLSPKPRWIHAAKTCMLDLDLPFCNLARVGLAIFGLGSDKKGLKEALSLQSHLVAITHGRRGERVGYDTGHLIAKKEARIGIIPLGYHDGIHRHYAGTGYVLIRGKKAPMIGHICMDFMMVDITDIPDANVGDRVVLFGPHLSPLLFAKWGKTSVRELLVCLGPRIQRQFIPNNLKNWHLDCAKASGFNDRKWPNINNIRPLPIVKSRELSR